MKLSLGITPRDYSVIGGASYDADAQAYFTANTSITNPADKTAINDFYLGLKTDGIYNNINAMFLPLWGSAASCKWNLVNPLDTDAAFRLNFSTGWTFSSNGALPNGTSAYANTFYIPNTNGTLNSSHISFYSATNSVGALIDIGANNSLGNQGATMLYTRFTGNLMYSALDYYPAVVGDYVQYSNSDSTGFYITSRTATNLNKSYKNGVFKSSNTKTGNRSTKEIYISALNKDNPNQITSYSNRQWRFISIGKGLDDTQSANLSSRVNTLMTYFGLNTY